MENKELHLQFETLDYQKDCVNNIIDALQYYDFKTNNIDSLKQGLQDLYKSQSSNVPLQLQNVTNSLQIDILMETGTGKTYTYFKAIFELNFRYKQNKFVLFVPRKSILEGVKQAQTLQHFYRIYKKISIYIIILGKLLI